VRRFLLRRLGQAVLVVVGVSLVVFFVIRLSGDPIYLLLPPTATEADRDAKMLANLKGMRNLLK